MTKNSEFLEALLGGGSGYGWVCAFAGDPGSDDGSKWYGRPYTPSAVNTEAVDSWGDRNTYYAVAEFRETEGGRSRRKQNFSRLLSLVVDDVDEGQISGVPTYILDTSPGKVQVGVFIDRDDADATNHALVDAIMSELYARKLLGDNSGNNSVRYVRLPQGLNQKPRPGGDFAHTLRCFRPGHSMTLADAAAVFGIDIDLLRAKAEEHKDMILLGDGQDKVLAEAIQRIVTGDEYHDSINKVAASMAASGAHPGAVTNLLRALMSAAQVPRDARWDQRYADIPRAVETGSRKYQVEPLAAPGEPVAEKPLLVHVGAFMDELSAIDWLVEGWAETEAMSMMFGPPNVGKSFVALDMACCVATGTPFHNCPVRQGPVVLVVGEGLAGVRRRLRAWGQAHGIDIRKAPIYVTTKAVRMLNGVEAQALAEAVDATVHAAGGIRPKLIVIDTLARNFGDGDENSAKDAGAFVDAVDDLLRRRYGAHTMIVHHSGHEAGRARGSSALKGAMDQEFSVVPVLGGEVIKLSATKMKDAEKPMPLEFKLTEIELGFDKDGGLITSAVLEKLTSDFDDVLIKGKNGNVTVGQVLCLVAGTIVPSERELCEKLGVSKDGAGSCIRKLVERGYVAEGANSRVRKHITDAGLKVLSAAGRIAEVRKAGEGNDHEGEEN